MKSKVWIRTVSSGAFLALSLSAVMLLAACGGAAMPEGDDARQQQLESLRKDNQELQRLRVENQDLGRLRRDNEEIKRLRIQTEALPGLREENQQLRSEMEALKTRGRPPAQRQP
jgi:TolA-binding protein